MKNTLYWHFSSGFYCCHRIVKLSYRMFLGIIFVALWSHNISAQNAIDYDAVVQKGKSQLQEGLADMALAYGERAIKANANRWEGYALAGGALMNLKRYEEAADKLSEAIKRAPQAKQTALRNLRRQCLLIESGTTPKDAPPATTTQPEIVLWKSIENSSNPVDFQSYLDRYPRGAFVVLAQRHLSESKVQAEQEQKQREAQQIAEIMWTDGSTGLMWSRPPMNAGYKTFEQAIEYCTNLRTANFSNWRVPTADELQHIYHKNSGQDIDGGIFTLWNLWTVTAANKKGEHIYIGGGNVKSANDQSDRKVGVLCVRNRT